LEGLSSTLLSGCPWFCATLLRLLFLFVVQVGLLGIVNTNWVVLTALYPRASKWVSRPRASMHDKFEEAELEQIGGGGTESTDSATQHAVPFERVKYK
jgi:hypothetical protein